MKSSPVVSRSLAAICTTIALVMSSSTAYGVVQLMAVEQTWTSTSGTPVPVPMWGFVADTGNCASAPPGWTIGPEISEADLDGNDLIIELRNCLINENVSIMIPGQSAENSPPVKSGNRITSFAAVTTPGTVGTYTWRGVGANLGTYLYMSGTHPAKQVQMGLYGALKVGGHQDTSGDVTLLYSEIDPALHSPASATTPLNYKPSYFLVNGKEEEAVTAGNTSQPLVLSFLNAGLDFHVPALKEGYMSLQAEDGNPYPHAKEQYSVLLPAGKTIEAFWQPTATGDHVIFDRRGHGMMATITVGTGGGSPVAGDDSYSTTEGTALTVAVPGVLANDDSGLTAELVSTTSSGVLTLQTNGSFIYTPTTNFNGVDSFTYRGIDGTTPSNIATVTLTVAAVNDMPVANADSYEAQAGETLSIPAPGVLGNDTDIDGDLLTVSPGTYPTGVALSSDGALTATLNTTTQFTYEVCDNGTPQGCATGNVSITVDTANRPPVAMDDTATVKRNSSPGTTDRGDPAGTDRNTFSVIINDSDDKAIDPETVIVSGTSRGGTVVSIGGGMVEYTPPPSWRGTDTFTYTVQDAPEGEISNEATVRVNVVRRRQLPPL